MAAFLTIALKYEYHVLHMHNMIREYYNNALAIKFICFCLFLCLFLLLPFFLTISFYVAFLYVLQLSGQ